MAIEFPNEKMKIWDFSKIQDSFGELIPKLDAFKKFQLESALAEVLRIVFEDAGIPVSLNTFCRKTVQEMERQENTIYRLFAEFEHLRERYNEVADNANFLHVENEDLYRKVEDARRDLSLAESKLKAIREILNGYREDTTQKMNVFGGFAEKD